MNYNRNFYWKNKLNKGINTNNLNSQGKKLLVAENRIKEPVLLELSNLDVNENNESIFINYTSSKDKELVSNFHMDDKIVDILQNLLREINIINKKIDTIQSNVNEIKDTINALSVGDVLYDDDLKILSKIRTNHDISSNESTIISESSITVSDFELDHKITFVPVLKGACRHPKNICYIKSKHLSLTLKFNNNDLDEYIIYPFGEDTSPISIEGLKNKLYLNLGGDYPYIFEVLVNEKTVISWKLKGLICKDEEIFDISTVTDVNCLIIEESLTFLYQ